MTDTTDREARLPGWARNELHAVRAEAARLRRQVAELSQPGSRVVANPYAMPGDAEPVGLGDRTTVRFVVDPSRTAEGVEVALRDDYVSMSTTYGALTIVPRWSNVVHVRVVDLYSGR